MFIFVLHEIHGFVETIRIISRLDNTFDLKFSLEMFSIMARLSRTSPLMIALQMFPPFFEEYYCYDLQYSRIDFDAIFPIMFHLVRNGYSTLTFSFEIPQLADLTFDGPNRLSRVFHLPLHQYDELKDVGEFDWSTFVSIDSQEFIHIVTSFYNFDQVLVTLTSSQVLFSSSRAEIILTPQRRQCIIGGLTPPNEIHFTVTLRPVVIFRNVANRSKRVWLYKSSNSSNGVICAPLGLYNRFLMYFPDGI